MAYEQRLGGTHQWRLLRKRAIRELPLICSNAQCRQVLDLTAPRGSATAAELDHIIPRRAGGTDTIENVQWMCAPCNRRKSDKTNVRGALDHAGNPYPPGFDVEWCCRHGSTVLATCPCPETAWSASYAANGYPGP